MTPSVVLITQPQADFDKLLALAHALLGYSPSSAVDRSRIEHSDTSKLISILAAVRDRNAQPGLTADLINHASYSVVIAADERDLMDILAAASGMPFIVADTVSRGVMMCYLTGDLTKWRDAVVAGTRSEAEFNVRSCYCQIKLLFDKEVGNLWKDFQTKPLNDNTFCIEDKRDRR